MKELPKQKHNVGLILKYCHVNFTAQKAMFLIGYCGRQKSRGELANYVVSYSASWNVRSPDTRLILSLEMGWSPCVQEHQKPYVALIIFLLATGDEGE